MGIIHHRLDIRNRLFGLIIGPLFDRDAWGVHVAWLRDGETYRGHRTWSLVTGRTLRNWGFK